MPGVFMSTRKYVMPLCLGASGSVRARHTPHAALCAADVHTFWPVSFQPPSARTAFVRSAARSDPAPGSLNSWHQMKSPRSVAGTNCSICSGLPCSRIVGTAHHPITRSGRTTLGLGELLVDEQLLGRAGLAAVRAWPVRRQQPSVGQGDLPLLGGLRGDFGYRRGDFGAQVLDRFEIDAQIAAHSLLGECRDAAQPLVRAAQEVRDAVRAPQIQMRIVFPGDPDAAEHLNAVLRVRLRGVDARSRGHRHGDGQLSLVGLGHRSGRISRGHRSLLGTQQHLGAHVLDGLETADRLAELLANLRVLGRGLQRPARQSGGFGSQHGGRHVDETLRRRGQLLRGRRIQHDARQWPREIGRGQQFDRDAVGCRVDQHDGISGG